ncbi:NUDIX domain-containing protein [Leifsonia shinshuensis]|uniref:NUDIX hydrolase n=1 Tax=Leifsonia shinshuensis TaxID=150026 RepID=UPI001F50FCD3|nr:NUDIX domain-containing protein [Leifsonia shinshuensis]MCI0156953.1 NUDIX domain-containing protein [Leifsonia shinshuensis]
MPHLNTGPGEYDLTASALILRELGGDLHLLVHRHRKLGLLMQPGGHVERTEDPWAAVAHELREESGYDLEQLLLLQPAHRIDHAPGVAVLPQPLCVDVHPIGDDHFHTDLVYGFVATTDPAGRPGEDESQELHWLALDALSAPEVQADLAPGLAEVARYAGASLTASMLVTMTPPRADAFAVSAWTSGSASQQPPSSPTGR